MPLSFRQVGFISTGVVIITLLFGLVQHNIMKKGLIRLEEEKNVALTRVFMYSMWPEYSALLQSRMTGTTAENPGWLPENSRLYQRVEALMSGLSVVKVRIYSPTGFIVFSTDGTGIGEDASGSPGVRTALGGRVINHLTKSGQMNTFEGMVEDRNIIESYLPIQMDDEGEPVLGVIELYSDVTVMLKQIRSSQQKVVFAMVATLLLFLFGVRLVGKTIKRRAKRES